MAGTVKLDVPITLGKQGEFFYLFFKTDKGDECRLDLSAICANHLEHCVVNTWADEQFVRGMVKRRRPTGLKDSTGRPLYEGDIVRRDDGEESHVAFIQWNPEYASFVFRAYLNNGGTLESHNLRGAIDTVSIGNCFENPELIVVHGSTKHFGEQPAPLSADAA
jgi:hypothetical protein